VTGPTLVPDIEQILLDVFGDGIAVANDQIGVVGVSVDQVNEDAVDYARERAAELVGMRYDADGQLVAQPERRVGDHRLDARHAARDIVDAIEEGTSTDDLADQLEENYAFSEARAETIARTEVATADVEGNLQAYRDSGEVEGKEWILGSEHPDIGCDCEDAADMGVVPLDDDFGGIGDPPAHPNCECDILPVLTAADDAEDDEG
jgi:hypothetical protein